MNGSPNNNINLNSIKELYPGQFFTLFNFATNKFLEHVLNDDYKYVWVSNHWVLKTHDHNEFNNWHSYNLPLIGDRSYNVLAKKIKFDFIMPTSEFKRVLPELPSGITLIQMNNLPKHYLDNERVRESTWYELLTKECDYLFEINLPWPDGYSQILTPNRDWLESLLNNKALNWDDLP
jgi:hypothetical protein